VYKKYNLKLKNKENTNLRVVLVEYEKRTWGRFSIRNLEEEMNPVS